MIKSATQLIFMERFLERVAMSEYKDKFILKGGMLVASLVGLATRATMDIDATVNALPLTETEIKNIVTEIGNIQLEDNITFEITSTETIMDDFDYPGIRVHMEGKLDNLKQPIKIDISTDDVITPRAVEYGYRLMFEDRKIRLQSYNIETLLAEKTQTILSRGLANTRMRDFYDIYEIVHRKDFDNNLFKSAFFATCAKRNTVFEAEQVRDMAEEMAASDELKDRWNQFRDKNYYVEELDFEDVMWAVRNVISITV